MATLTIELPDELVNELNEQQLSNEFVDVLIEQALRAWLRKGSPKSSDAKPISDSPFAHSAAEFAERLIDQNRELFERLAQL